MMLGLVNNHLGKNVQEDSAWPNIKNCDGYLPLATEQNSELPPFLNRVLNSELPDYEYEFKSDADC
jgi:hypothetical protein